MTSRTRANAPTSVVESQRHHDSMARLQFKEPLSWRVGKPITVAVLLSRLETLSKELRSMEQETVDRDSLTTVAKELATHNLLAHKDPGIKAWTACCLADVLRLCAPDAPYTTSQLKDVFTLFVTTILPALADPSNPYNSQHLYVLQSLATVKSIVLLADISSSSALILHLFTCSFDVLSGPSRENSGEEELSKNVEYHLTAILATMVDECQGLPTEVVDIILAQFLRADPRILAAAPSKSKKSAKRVATDQKQTTLTLKQLPPAYNMAKNICNSCSDKMVRYVSQYFSTVIVEASALSINGTSRHKGHKRAKDDNSDSEDNTHKGPSEEDLKEIHKAHRLLRELWRSSSTVLQNVIPQLEAELSAENAHLRILATETMGDMISGIGAAGPPSGPSLDPSAYPPVTLNRDPPSVEVFDALTTPSSPQSFSQAYSIAYQSYLSRRNDKSALVRAAWTTGIGRILMTSAGGVGLSPHESEELVRRLAEMLEDSDETVRLTAVKAVELFDLKDIVQKIGSIGGVGDESSVLHKLAERVRDPKHLVRTEAMTVLGRIWGVAVGELANGNEVVDTLLGRIPSKILDTVFINNVAINGLVDQVLFEDLLPLAYPPIKSKPVVTNGDSQRVKDSQSSGKSGNTGADADRTRAERMLLLVKCLDQRAKVAFFNFLSRQVLLAKHLNSFLARCEEYNAGVTESNEKQIKGQLKGLVDYLAKTLPDPARASEDLMKFAKMHDRRSYQLIRFCTAAESDYRKVYKAIKELMKRIGDAPGAGATMSETLKTLVLRASNLVCNRSHVPAIMEISRTHEQLLGGAAQEVLKEMSARNPEVLRTHVQELCRVVQEQTPTVDRPNDPAAADTLKACAGFARRYPQDISKDRKLFQSLIGYAIYGVPPTAAKYALSILMAVADRKEMYAKDVLGRCTKDFEYGVANYLAKLATLSQLVLLAPKEAEEEIDVIVGIAIDQVLLKVRTPGTDNDPDWQDIPDEECEAKMWALKILVNRLRSFEESEDVNETAAPVYKLLGKLITNKGELSKTKNTPKPHKNRLRLLAAKLSLKLCSQKRFDGMLKPEAFDNLANVAQDPLFPVRHGFIKSLEKYLNQNKLSQRFTVIAFLLAYDPSQSLKEETVRWLRSRCLQLSKLKSTAMEKLFARFLSLLAHHQDFSSDPDDLCDFVRFIMFYLECVANQNNISLIYHMAQRVKSVKDAVRPEESEKLYYLSDLSQAVIRRFEDLHGWSIQMLPTKVPLPSDLFAPLPNHDVAQDIAMKQYLPEEVLDRIDELVSPSKKTKKRKSDNADHGDSKRVRTSPPAPKVKLVTLRKTSKVTKTPKRKKTRESEDIPSSERRRSGRQNGQKSYAEQEESEADAEMQMWDQAADEEDSEDDSSHASVSPNGSNKENRRSNKTKAAKGPEPAKHAVNGSKKQKKKATEESENSSDEELSDPPDSDEGS